MTDSKMSEEIMTEREKMVSGELYDPTDKELEQFLISPAWMYVKYI